MRTANSVGEHIIVRTGPWFAAAALCALCAWAPRIEAAEKLLRWKFAQGDRLLVAMQQTVNMTASVAGSSVETKIDLALEMTWVVDEVGADGAAQMTQTFTRLKAALSLPENSFEYDSGATAPPTGAAREFAAAAGPLIGAPFQVTMSTRGEITRVELPEAAAKLADSKTAGAALKQLLSKEGLTTALAQASPVLPLAAIEAGFQWSEDRTAALAMGKLNQKTTYTYEGPAQRDGATLDKIAVTSAVVVAPPEKKTDDLPDTKLAKSEHSGTLWFDAEAGRFVSAESKQTLETRRQYREFIARVTTESTLTATFREAP